MGDTSQSPTSLSDCRAIFDWSGRGYPRLGLNPSSLITPANELTYTDTKENHRSFTQKGGSARANNMVRDVLSPGAGAVLPPVFMRTPGQYPLGTAGATNSLLVCVGSDLSDVSEFYLSNAYPGNMSITLWVSLPNANWNFYFQQASGSFTGWTTTYSIMGLSAAQMGQGVNSGLTTPATRDTDPTFNHTGIGRIKFTMPLYDGDIKPYVRFLFEKTGTEVLTQAVCFYGVVAISDSTPAENYRNESLVSSYDDPTMVGKLLSVDWFSGRKEPSDLLPETGTASVILNNVGAYYSPDHVASKLYTYPIYKTRVWILVAKQDATAPTGFVWRLAWVGRVKEYEVSPLTTSDQTITFTCEQSLDYFNNMPFKGNTATTGYTYLRDGIDQVFIPDTEDIAPRVDYARVDYASFIPKIDWSLVSKAALPALHAPISVGGLIEKKASRVRDVLENIVDLENGYYWLDEQGRHTLGYRGMYSAMSPLATFAPGDFTELSFIGRKPLAYNSLLNSEPVWVNQGTLTPPGGFGYGVPYIMASIAAVNIPAYERVVFYGNCTTPDGQDIVGADATIYRSEARKALGGALTTNFAVGVALFDNPTLNAGWGKQYVLRIWNFETEPIIVTCYIAGGAYTQFTGTDHQVGTTGNLTGLEWRLQEEVVKEFDNPYLGNANEMSAWAFSRLAMDDVNRGFFDQVTHVVGGIYISTAHHQVRLGSLISIGQDNQATSRTNKHIVQGIEGRYRPGNLLTYTWYLAPGE